MRKLRFLFLLSLALAFCSSLQAQTNMAITATSSTSYVSPWETLSAINDGSSPSSSSDNSQGAYGNWNNPNSIQWVQYDWTENVTFTSTQVYWFDDGGGVLTPTTAYAEYWNGSSWVSLGNVPRVKDAWNTLSINDVTTTRLRLSMSNTSQSTGILEWRAIGYVGNSGCPATSITPYYQVNGGSWSSGTNITVASGDDIRFGPQPTSGGSWSWSGPAGYTSTTRQAVVSNVTSGATGTYTAVYTNSCGTTSSASFYVSVSTNSGESFEWPEYSPNISYNFADEFPSLSTPTQVLDDCPQVVGTSSSDWWTFRWGPNANSLVTSAAITPLLQRMNTDFAYFRDEMGWPPDLRAKNGYRSAVYLYGSGLCTDNASNTDLGGWQSAIYYNGTSWPMVLASYYPIYSFDPACTYPDKEAQQSAMVHEGIHALLADLPGVKQSAWFHEGGNVWLQQTADARRNQNYSSMGFLNGTDFIAPFMPIECYSGWLQDGSFGGPSAEGVNMFDGNQQICTWRTYLGGHQYSTSFPTFVGLTLGDGAIPWIWRYCEGRVLEGMADGIGEAQIRRLISEYRAKQALVDFGPWRNAIVNLIDGNFQTNIGAEWQPSWLNPEVWVATPYVKTTNNGSGLLTPESRTTPGWSGANQIPLTVTGDSVAVNFQPIGENMTCQLVYRNTSGEPVYSALVESGPVSLKLDQPSINGVVIAVVTNTDYIYEGESTRTAHFDYRLQLVSGVSGAASPYTRWYRFNSVNSSARSGSVETQTGIDWAEYCFHSNPPVSDMEVAQAATDADLMVYPNPVAEGGVLKVEFANKNALPTDISVVDIYGKEVYKGQTNTNSFDLLSGAEMKSGMYIIKIKNAVTDVKRKVQIK
ncbi:T9SS type A sorting domain-containing protein [Fulvivirga maritima]|uniref:T9SS type A sorting domain-containing protein n=1 Tax=Fulvivirga maritima TaxID=2904247 RepID=UPI001F418845|nr:T9SS type A sorting domain-containing protein [Fulvivirga maritima]UII26195.1 T9SS type A sorting domain-containing protein [Fulvivirga maritima]